MSTRFRLGATTGVAWIATLGKVTLEHGAPPGGVPTPTATRTPTPTTTPTASAPPSATRTPTPAAAPVSGAPPVLRETYDYDLLGNLRVTAGVAYDDPAAGQPRPHAPPASAGSRMPTTPTATW